MLTMPKVTIHARFENFIKIRKLVEQTAKNAGFDGHSIYKIQLAVDEACSNIVEHAYGGEGGGEIECSCQETSDGIRIVLRDWGSTFDPNSVPAPRLPDSVQDVEPRGAGLFLIRKLMDDVRFEFSSDHGNRLSLFKRRT
jgi:serine/threonine-protein kinase RsbW